jgi:hypothetical protein
MLRLDLNDENLLVPGRAPQSDPPVGAVGPRPLFFFHKPSVTSNLAFHNETLKSSTKARGVGPAPIVAL